MQRMSAAVQFFEEAAYQSDTACFAFDLDRNKFLYVNPAFEQLFSKLLQSNPNLLLQHVHDEDQGYLLETFHELLGKASSEVKFRLLRASHIRWIYAKACLVGQGTGDRVIVGTARDVSEQKSNEDNLHEFAAKKDSILEILSHDLAGPLSKIKALTYLIGEELKQHDHPMLDEMGGKIEETTGRCIRMIREFIKHEFLKSQDLPLLKQREDIVEKMREVMDQYKSSEKEIAKTFLFAHSKDKIFADIDTYKFTQAINNLISNAIKFTEDGGRIRLGLEDRGSSVLITISDDGIGIPVRFHNTLFDKFTEARRPGLKGEPSVGLGMSVIKTIIEWHGGTITFESKENEGTTFFIELPKE